jgi:rhamnosyltransferase
VFAIDNTPGSSSAKPKFIEKFKSFVSYIPLGENRGIAEAQNIGIELSIKGGYSHVLLLDQDSTLSPRMVNKLLSAEQELLNKGQTIAAMVPQIVDERTGQRPCAYRYGWLGARKVFRNIDSTVPVQTDFFIASGSLIRTSILQALGTMRSDLLIDHVDTEWALRGHNAGYNSYCVPNAVLIHSLGDTARKVLGKDIFLYTDIRYYYRLRNEVYLARLKTMGWQWRVYILPIIPYHFVLYSYLSKNRLRTSRLLMKAIWDGFLGRLGPLA